MLSELIDPFCDPTLPELCIRLLVDDVCKHNTYDYTVRHQVLYMNDMQHMLMTYDQTGNSKIMHCGILSNMPYWCCKSRDKNTGSVNEVSTTGNLY